MFKKKEFQILMERLSEPRARIQGISGPRQVGKSTMVKQVQLELIYSICLKNWGIMSIIGEKKMTR